MLQSHYRERPLHWSLPQHLLNSTLAISPEDQPVLVHRESHDHNTSHAPWAPVGMPEGMPKEEEEGEEGEEYSKLEQSDILGIPMHRLSRPVQFGICVCGIVLFYLLYGYSQVL